MFGDLDFPPNASLGFVSISWASCFKCSVIVLLVYNRDLTSDLVRRSTTVMLVCVCSHLLLISSGTLTSNRNRQFLIAVERLLTMGLEKCSLLFTHLHTLYWQPYTTGICQTAFLQIRGIKFFCLVGCILPWEKSLTLVDWEVWW